MSHCLLLIVPPSSLISPLQLFQPPTHLAPSAAILPCAAWPPGSAKLAPSFAATNSRRKGGRIILLDEQSERTIVERFEGRGIGPLTVTFPNGSQGGEEEFRQLIGSATADLYRNGFAFSLSELQTMESLATEKVRDAIYSAGIGIGRRTITDVIQELRRQSGELFSPGGSKPAMNQALSKIEDYSPSDQRSRK